VKNGIKNNTDFTPVGTQKCKTCHQAEKRLKSTSLTFIARNENQLVPFVAGKQNCQPLFKPDVFD
jgi:hypothetical protein